MKRISFIMMSAAMLVAFASCEKKPTPAPEPIEEMVTIFEQTALLDDCNNPDYTNLALTDPLWGPNSAMNSNGLAGVWGHNGDPDNALYTFCMYPNCAPIIQRTKPYEPAVDAKTTIENGVLSLWGYRMPIVDGFGIPVIEDYLNLDGTKWAFEISSSGHSGENSLVLYLDSNKIKDGEWSEIKLPLKDGVPTGNIDLSKVNFFAVSNQGVKEGTYFWFFLDDICFGEYKEVPASQVAE